MCDNCLHGMFTCVPASAPDFIDTNHIGASSAMFDREEIKRLLNKLQQSRRIPPGIITIFWVVAGILADLKLGDQYRYWILLFF